MLCFAMLWLPNKWSNAKHVFVSMMLFTVELLEYATWLGMNLPEESELLWVAREGLKAPLPEHWKPWWLHSPSPKYASWLQSIKMNKVVRHLFVIYIQLYGTGQQEKGFGNSKSVLTKVDCPRTCCLVQGDWSWHTWSILYFSCSRSEDDEIYYFNFQSGESVWEHPCDDYYRYLQ